ncbi:hypothetical protein [Rhodobaculum claviforme]|uniref:HPt domain-containing protein n=1 Tax=Rhodobaculum claviforme TaxID=1549854 RepID=A0A934TJ00_9RHOB|nr:hypothetical protein [Rhodobaculum claviforme]MBK5926959.1 hypothetical protein [Rhodobaculum claviforme]
MEADRRDTGRLTPGEAALADLVTALAQVPPGGLDPVGRAALASARLATARLAAGPWGVPVPAPRDLPDLGGYAVLAAAPALPAAVVDALRGAGAHVFRAPSVAAALGWLEIAPCDLVLLAHDLDGAEAEAARVLTAIRAQAGAPGRAPVLGLGPWAAGEGLDAVVPVAAPGPIGAALVRVRAQADAALVADCAQEPVVDAERYGRLIEMAGADAARELLERLGEDLDSVSRGLVRALADGPSMAEIRAQTHVLISLAGAVGADPLQRLAEALNAAANRGAPDDIARLGAVTLDRLGVLMRFVAAQEGRQADGVAPI